MVVPGQLTFSSMQPLILHSQQKSLVRFEYVYKNKLTLDPSPSEPRLASNKGACDESGNI